MNKQVQIIPQEQQNIYNKMTIKTKSKIFLNQRKINYI